MRGLFRLQRRVRSLYLRCCLQFRILHGSFEFDTAEWGHISNAAKHLVCGLLTVDPSARFTMEQSLNHPWITGIGMDLLPPVPDKPTFNEEFIARTAAYASLSGGSASAGISRSGSQTDLRSSSAAGGGPAPSPAQPPQAVAITTYGTPISVSSSVSSSQHAANSIASDSAMGSPLVSTGLALGPPPALPLAHFGSEAGFAGLSSVPSPAHRHGHGWPLDVQRSAASWPAQAPPALSLQAIMPSPNSFHGTLPAHLAVPPPIPTSHSAGTFFEARGPPPLRSNSVHTEESGDRSITYQLTYSTDAKGVVTSVSDQLAELLGRTRASVVGKHAAQIVSASSADVFRMLEVTGSCLNTPVAMLHSSGHSVEVRLIWRSFACYYWAELLLCICLRPWSCLLTCLCACLRHRCSCLPNQLAIFVAASLAS